MNRHNGSCSAQHPKSKPAVPKQSHLRTRSQRKKQNEDKDQGEPREISNDKIAHNLKQTE
jgi:hypothetical protein